MNNTARALQPTTFLRLIMTEENDPPDRVTPTDVVPALDDPERDTLPPDSKELEGTRRMQTMLPAGANLPFREPPDWWEGSFFQSVFNDVTSTKSVHNETLEGQRQILTAVERADRNQEANWKTTQEQLKLWRELSEAKHADSASKIQALERQMSKLKEELVELVARATRDAAQRIEALERELEKVKADVPARATAPQSPEAADPT